MLTLMDLTHARSISEYIICQTLHGSFISQLSALYSRTKRSRRQTRVQYVLKGFFQKELGSQHIPFFSVLSHHRECDTPGSCLLLSAITANPKIFKGSSVGLPSKALSRNNMRPFASTVAHRPSSALPFPTAASDTLDVRGWSVPLQKRQSLGMLLCDTNPQAPPGMPAAL